MAISDGLGIQALVQSYDKKAVSQAFAEIAKDFNKSADELNNEINKIKIDKDVMNNLVNQIKALPEEVRKKTQGMSFDLFSDLINADGAEEKIDEAFKVFSNKIQSFVKLRDQIGNDKIIIETDLEDLNKLTDKMREVIELQSQIKGIKKSQKRTGLEDDLKSAQNEINTWTQARQQLEKYDGSLEEVKDTIAKLANEFRDNKLGSFNLIEKKNIEQIKEMVGWLERYVQLSGDEKLSGLKDFGIKGGVIDLKQLYRGDINANSSDLRKQYQEYADVVKKYISLNKSVSSSGGGTGDSFGFGASKEEAEELLSIIKEIRNILNDIKDNRSILDSENILSSDKIDEISSRFNEIASNFGDDLVTSVDDFTNSLKEVDNIDWSFDNLKNSLLNIVIQFQNSLASVNLSSTQLDEAYKMIKGWNDADSYSVTRGKITSHERGAFLNSKTGTVSNSYFIDAEKSFSVQLFNALEKLSVGLNGEISSLYDTFIHSHPFRTAIDNLKTTGSDIGFSYSDLDIAINKFLKEKVNNMMVTSNYKYANLDLSGVEEIIANELLKHFRSELVKSGLEIDNNNRIVFPKDLAANNGVFDFDQKSNIVNGALKQALKNVGLDENRFTTGNIEDLKIDISQLESQGEETNGTFQELLDVLRNISNVLTEINTKGFKFDTVEQLNNTNQNKLQSEFKESNSEAENLLNTLNKIQSKIDLISNSSKLYDVLNLDHTKFSNFNEKYKEVFTLLSEYKQTVLEINNLKLQPQTEETQKKIEELSLLAMRLGEQFQNITHLNDADVNGVIKQYGFSKEDIKIYSGDFIKIDKDALLNSLTKQLWDVYDELVNKFPEMSGIEFDSNNINPFSFITDELERIKSTGKSTFDSINVDLMNSKDYVEDLRSALNKIVNSNNGKGSKDGLDGYYAIKHRPELEQFKDITTMLPEEEFNKFLSTLEKAQPYLDSIGYKVKEVKEDTVEINNDVKHPKIEDKSGDMQQQDSSSIISEQQTLNNLEQAIKSVIIAIAEKNKAIQAEEVQMDLSINQEIKKLEELKGKLNEIKTEFEQGIASGLFKNTNNEDVDGASVNVDLKPTVDANKFKEDAERLLTFVDVKKEVNLKVGELDTSNITDNISTIASPVSENIANDDVIEEQNKDLEEQQFLYNNIIRLLTEYLSLQDRINSGNKSIVTGNYIYHGDIRKQTGKVSQRAVKDQLNNYLHASKNEKGFYDDNSIKRTKEQLAAYVANFDNVEKAAEIFGNKNKELFNEICQMIDDARVSLDAYNNAQVNIDVAESQLAELNKLQTGEKLTYGQLFDLEKVVRTDGLEAGLKYITDELGIKIPEAAKKAESAIAEVNNELSKPQQSQQQMKPIEGQTGNQDQEDKKSEVIQVPVEPLIVQSEWEAEIDRILEAIGNKKIKIEPDTTSEEWNTLKNYIDNISKQVINMKFINGDSALPSDLSTSYTNSTKYVTELYKIEEKIARTKENNNKRELENLTTLEAEKKKFEDLLRLEEQFRANDRFKDFDTTVKDNNLNKLISTKEQEYQANRVAAETSLTNKLPSIEEEAYKVNESFNNTKSLEKVNSLLDEQKKKWQEIQDIRIQMETLDLNDSANKDQNKTEYENLDAQKKYLEEEKKLIDDELKQYDSLIDKATELKQIRELDKITSNADSQINGDRISNISNAYNEAVRINNALNNTETTLENLKNTIRDVRNQTSNEIFGNALKNAEQDAEELKTQLISGQISLSQYNSAIRNIQKDVSAQKDAVGFIDVDDIDQAREALTNYAREVTNGTIENVQWNASTSTLTGSFVNENKEVQKVTASIKQLSTGSQVATVSFGKAEKQVTSFSKFIDELGAKFRNLSTYLLSFVGFYEVWGAIQQGVTYVRELDTALTEMRKVSDETVESLREFQEESFDIADSVGATAKTIQNSTADWMRLGESIEEAAKSAEVSNILLNVSEFTDINDATDALVSMSQAYNEFEKIDIVDKLNNIGNLYSISTDGIATALQDSASALTTAGNTLDEAIALVTAGNAIVQDPNSVGSGKLMPEHIVICGCLFYKC